MAYRLQFPPYSTMHPIFHVLMLKKKIGQQVLPEKSLPPINPDGQFLVEPVAILERRIVKRQNRVVHQVRIQWFNMSPEEATWEDCDTILRRFPNFDP